MSLGPLSGHMAQHILLMNVVAPALALTLIRLSLPLRGRALLAATLLQLVLIWGWHAPGVLPIAANHSVLHLAMQASLFAGALLFWGAVFAIGGSDRWKPIVALLVTSKLFCLLGVLLAFSPRLLYDPGMCGPLLCPPPVLLVDQQLAGLLMLIACPTTYLLAGVVIAARWLVALEAYPARRSPA